MLPLDYRAPLPLSPLTTCKRLQQDNSNSEPLFLALAYSSLVDAVVLLRLMATFSRKASVMDRFEGFSSNLSICLARLLLGSRDENDESERTPAFIDFAAKSFTYIGHYDTDELYDGKSVSRNFL